MTTIEKAKKWLGENRQGVTYDNKYWQELANILAEYEAYLITSNVITNSCLPTDEEIEAAGNEYADRFYKQNEGEYKEWFGARVGFKAGMKTLKNRILVT